MAKRKEVDYEAFGRAVARILKNTRRTAKDSDDALTRDIETLDAILEEEKDHGLR